MFVVAIHYFFAFIPIAAFSLHDPCNCNDYDDQGDNSKKKDHRKVSYEFAMISMPPEEPHVNHVRIRSWKVLDSYVEEEGTTSRHQK